MTLAELQELHSLPFFDLLKRARAVHEKFWPEGKIQLCTLLSIKTGGCSEDCAYCAQSARYKTELESHVLLEREEVMTTRPRRQGLRFHPLLHGRRLEGRARRHPEV